VSGNTVTIPALIDGNLPGYVGIASLNDQQLSVGQNSVADYGIAIQTRELSSSGIYTNVISNSNDGVQIYCSSNNTVALNKIGGQLPGVALPGFLSRIPVLAYPTKHPTTTTLS
jgi:hypothetical protein